MINKTDKDGDKYPIFSTLQTRFLSWKLLSAAEVSVVAAPVSVAIANGQCQILQADIMTLGLGSFLG